MEALGTFCAKFVNLILTLILFGYATDEESGSAEE